MTWIDGADTLANYTIFNDGFLSESGLRAVGAHTPVTDMGTYNEFYSGVFTTNDTSIAFEKTLYAPKASDACFMIQKLKVYSYDGATHDGLSLGEAIDWDIPSDSGSNDCGFDVSRNLIYQIGYEYDQDTTECLNNDVRHGGMAFLEWFYKDYEQADQIPDTMYFYTALSSTYDGGVTELQANIDAAIAWYGANVTTTTDANTTSGTDFVGAYVLDNPTWVYPAGGFRPSQLYANMNTQHASDQYVCFTDSITDLHMVMTFMNGVELSGKGCCIGTRGNANGDELDKANISDVSYMLAWLFGIPSGPAPVCIEEANANGDELEKANISDVSYMLAWLFGIPSGPAPPACP